MKLGELKQTLDTLENDDFIFSDAFNKVHSYRGYYDEVAFSPFPYIRLRQVKEVVNKALTQKFYGYKGGEYRYDEYTPCNLAEYGSCGDSDYEDFEELVKAMVEEYVEAGQPLKEMKMARETKAERLVREEAERQAALEQARVEYFPKLMALLERACKNNMELTVEGGSFYVRDRDEGSTWLFEPEFSTKVNMWELDALDAECEAKEEAEREWQRKHLVRQQALAKLTREEREELGLPVNSW